MESSEHYDLVVVGGGITGAGVARDAALRGLKVALFEKNDFGFGTSSRSSKLIHGGLRYLEHGEIGLVFESVSERYVQSRVGPHLVRPLPFLVPVYRGARWGINAMSFGLWIYDALAMFRAPRIHKTYRGKRAYPLVPHCKVEDLRGVIEYYDCYTDDARLVLENVLDAAACGARCENYHQVVSIERDNQRVHSVTVKGATTEKIQARCVVMATGPWTDELNRAFGLSLERPLLRRTKGVHLVFEREKMPLERAITMLSPIDGRVMFAIPWRDRLVLGTTDTDFSGSADEVFADKSDAEYLCESANRFFQGVDLRPSDVIATWAGLRPLIDEGPENASAVSREHQIIVRDDGVVLIAGGKLTTYRLMARQVVDECVSWLGRNYDDYRDKKLRRIGSSKHRPLPGAEGLTQAGWSGIEALAGELEKTLPRPVANHLAWTYGSRAGRVVELLQKDSALAEPMVADLPFVWAEVPFAVGFDRARTVEDVLVRRIPLALVDREQGLGVAEKTAQMIGQLLDWSESERREQVAHYRDYVEKTRRFRTASPQAQSAVSR